MIAQTTPTGKAIAQAIEQGYALGEIKHCVLLRRGFNHVYGLEFVGGRRAVARLSADRPRGAPNSEYEAAFLRHLRRANVAVAASIPTRDGSAAVEMALPEGQRLLMLFEHLDGEPPGESLLDVEATGRGLALLHEAGETYKGPSSRYVLELPFLLDASIERICAAPTTDAALRCNFLEIGRRLAARITAMPTLTRVACHGDCHGGNNFMTEDKTGTRIASFFDFDDAGPGWMSYDLSVYLWSMLPRQVGTQLDAPALERWRRYLKGYRSVRAVASNDFDAIAAFVAVRQCWLMGEHAGRISVWGTQTIPTSYLRKQVELFSEWESLTTPD
jgi:Ser/Thr protein kinase RdoA (MazF antagonist)